MNAGCPLCLKLRVCAAATMLAHCLIAANASAQNYVPPYGYGPATPPSQTAYGMPHYAAPAGYAAPVYPASAPMLAGPYHRRGYPYCPPGYQPHTVPPAMQPQQTAPRGESQQPSQPSPSGEGAQPSDQSSAAQDQQMQQPQQPQTDFTPSPQNTGRASPSPGMNTPMLGRLDQSNRLNLFDNMAAQPQSRVWFGYQRGSDFDTGLRLSDGFQTFLKLAAAGSLPPPNVNFAYGVPLVLDPNKVLQLNQGITTDFFQYDQDVYRVGAEWAATRNFSVSVQGQYYASSGEFPDAAPEDWTNPQIMLKYVLSRDHDSILSATVGVTPETSSEFAVINERVTKIYPGMLFYEGLTRDLFAQGGAQVGLPVDGSNEVYTADWSLALGYWLYRDAPGRSHAPHFLRALHITGLVPQINILGKHTLGDNRIVGPFGFDSFASVVTIDTTTATYEICDPVTHLPVPGLSPITIVSPVTIPFVLPEGFVVYEEPEAVIDMTVGGQILVGQHVQLGLGFSFPLTDGSVRQGEFLSTLTLVY